MTSRRRDAGQPRAPADRAGGDVAAAAEHRERDGRPAGPAGDRSGAGSRRDGRLDRPLVFGTPGTGLAGPSSEPVELVGRSVPMTAAALGGRAVALAPVPAAGTVPIDDVSALPRVEVGERVRRHPYVRLALNGSFSALWTGQLISLFGDRVHQVALTFLVAAVTNSPLAVAFVFVAATIPNLLLSPIAGTYVDRWNQRDVMIVSDLLRAACVLMIPIVAVGQHLSRLPADLPDHLDLDLLPTRPGRDPAADRPGRRAGHGELARCGPARPSPTSSAIRWPASSSPSSERRCRWRSGSTRRPTPRRRS